jgi:thermitase
MDREYYVRGQRKTVEQVDNVNAIHVAPNERGEARVGASSFGTAAGVAEVGMPEDTLKAFEKARWLFVKPSRETTRALDARETVENAEEAGKVVKRPNGRVAIITRRLNVQLSADIPAEEADRILAEKGLRLLTRLRFAPNLFEVDTLVHADALAASVDLNADSRFILAEPDFVEHVPVRLRPTDPRFVDQWQWTNTGQSGGTVGADVRVEQAWDHTRGAGIRVAVIDNGFNAGHEDLQAGIVGVSGFFRQNGSNPAVFVQGVNGMPASNHGTFCAGMVGARHNNTFGGCGAAPECELMLVACLGDQVGTQTTLARAVAYAADPATEVPGMDPGEGADILVSSLGPNGADWDLTATLQLAIEFAARSGRNDRGLAIFWAASNGNNVNVMQDEVVSHPDVIAVVRSTRRDLEDNAARGAEVELIAPGVDVVSTTGGGGYDSSTGTSFAAPCAAGCAALALSINPAMTRDQLRTIMRETADKIGGVVYDATGHNDDYGFGRVNAYQAVLRAAESVQTSVALKDIALVRQTPGWNTIPVAFAQGDGTWKVTNGEAPNFIADWAHQPGVRVVMGDFNGQGLTDIALVRQTPGWNTIPVAFAQGDGTWKVTNGEAPNFIADWAHQPGVRLMTGDFHG